MKTKGLLICFTGIDGSGKTTLSKELVELLKKKGVKCKYVYGRLNPLILKPFIFIGDRLFLRGKDISEDYLEYSNTKKKVIVKYSFLSKLYQQILLFDYLLQMFFKVKLPLIFGKNIICDRYVYDTVITDLSIDMDYSETEIKKALKKCFYTVPKPDLSFLIDLPEVIAFQRKDDTPSVEYLKERRKIYLDVGKEEGMVILDGSIPLNNLKCVLEDRVEELIKWVK